MRKLPLSLSLLIICVLVSSCMSTRLVAKYDSDNIIHHHATKVTYLWGAIAPKDVEAKCESNAICQIKTETNLGFICISFLTLGIVVPQKIVWDCCGTNIKEEPFK